MKVYHSKIQLVKWERNDKEIVIELKLKTKYMLAEQKGEWTVFYRKGN